MAAATKTMVLYVKGRKDQTQRQHGAQVVHEAGGKHRLAVVGLVQTELQHDGIDDGHRSRGERHPREPTRFPAPAEPVVSRGRAAEKRSEKPDQSDPRCFLPFRAKHHRIELRAGKKCEHDRTCARQKFDPGLVSGKRGTAGERSDRELRDDSDRDFSKRCGNLQPNGQQRRQKRKSQPQRRERPDICHGAPFSLFPHRASAASVAIARASSGSGFSTPNSTGTFM